MLPLLAAVNDAVYNREFKQRTTPTRRASRLAALQGDLSRTLRPLRAPPPAGVNVFTWGKEVRCSTASAQSIPSRCSARRLPSVTRATDLDRVTVARLLHPQNVEEMREIDRMQLENERQPRQALADAHYKRITGTVAETTPGRRRAMRGKKMWARW